MVACCDKKELKKYGGNITNETENYERKLNYELNLSYPKFLFDITQYIPMLTF